MKTAELAGLFALLFLLLGIGLVAQSYKESFTNAEVATEPKIETHVSPVMANLSDAMMQQSQKKQQRSTQVDAMGRDADVIAGLESQSKDSRGCPVCKEQCPDMSKYIRRDSIPCWNCSL